MKIKVPTNLAKSLLKQSLVEYQLEQEREQERYKRELESGKEVVDYPPPDLSDKFELYGQMLNEHLEDHVFLDEEAFRIIFKGQL